jgi:hypothetical protein
MLSSKAEETRRVKWSNMDFGKLSRAVLFELAQLGVIH